MLPRAATVGRAVTGLVDVAFAGWDAGAGTRMPMLPIHAIAACSHADGGTAGARVVD